MDKTVSDLKRIALKYSFTEEGSWLNEINWTAIPVSITELPKDVCGMYSFGRIWLMPCLQPEAVFSTYVHELRHRWQKEKHLLMFLAGKVIRPIIENDAEREEAKAQAWINGRETKPGWFL